MGHDQERRRRPHDDIGGGQGGGAAGKRTRTQAIGARRPSPPAGTAHEPRPTGAVAAALDGLLDPFGLHLLGNDDQAEGPTTSDADAAIGGATAATTSAGALLRSDPTRRQFGQTRVGEVSAPQPVRITNLTDDALDLVDAIVDGPMFRFLGMDAQELGPGESTHVHLGFEPTAEKLASGSCTIETDRGMGVSIRLIGRGTASLAAGLAAHEPAAQAEQAAKDHAETKADHLGAARRGEVDVAPTYASMAAAFELAIEEAGRGNQRWAHTLAVAVRDRLAEVAPEGRVVAALRDHGVSLHAALFELGVAKEATTNLASRLANDHDVAQQRLLARFQTGRATIELVTGESDDAGKYAGFDRASVLTTGVVSAVPVAVAVAVAAPEVVSALIVRATPIAIAEAATFWFATKEVFAWGANYVLANPQAALAWTEFLGPLVIEGAENWGQRDQFIERLQTRDGFLSVLMQMMMGLAEVRQVSGGGGRGAPSDRPAAPAGARPRGSVADESPDLTAPAQRLVQDGLDELAALASGIRATRAGVDVPMRGKGAGAAKAEPAAAHAADAASDGGRAVTSRARPAQIDEPSGTPRGRAQDATRDLGLADDDAAEMADYEAVAGQETSRQLKAAKIWIADPSTVYHHNIGKGGLRAIVKTGRMRGGFGNSGHGGGQQVRAWFGPAPQRAGRDTPTIEFTTNTTGDVRPYSGRVGAYWRMEELNVTIARIYMADGSIVMPAGTSLQVTRLDGTRASMSVDDLPE